MSIRLAIRAFFQYAQFSSLACSKQWRWYSIESVPFFTVFSLSFILSISVWRVNAPCRRPPSTQQAKYRATLSFQMLWSGSCSSFCWRGVSWSSVVYSSCYWQPVLPERPSMIQVIVARCLFSGRFLFLDLMDFRRLFNASIISSGLFFYNHSAFVVLTTSVLLSSSFFNFRSRFFLVGCSLFSKSNTIRLFTYFTARQKKEGYTCSSRLQKDMDFSSRRRASVFWRTSSLYIFCFDSRFGWQESTTLQCFCLRNSQLSY